MVANRMSRDEYKAIQVQNTGQSSAMHSNYEKAKVLRQAVSEVRSLQGNRPPVLFPGQFGIKVKIHTNRRPDRDNVEKGILDALNGVAFVDDRDCQKGQSEFCRG